LKINCGESHVRILNDRNEFLFGDEATSIL